MATNYYIRQPSDEWEAFERWENEGGRLRQSHDLSLDSIGRDHLRRMEQAVLVGRLGEPAEINYATLFLAPDEPNFITGRTLAVGGV